MSQLLVLAADKLRPYCDPASLGFASTADLPTLPGIIGQERALQALQFGMGVHVRGYNIFVLGPAGTGKATAVRQFIEDAAAKAPPADDWVYVFNFRDPGHPNAMRLPSGRGQALRDGLAELVKELQRSIPTAFESEDYTRERDNLINALKTEQEGQLRELTETVEKFSFSLIRMPGGFLLAPVVNGRPITDEQFEQLSDEQKGKVRKLREKLQEQVDRSLAQMRERERRARTEIAALDEHVARFTIQHPMAELTNRFANLPEVSEYLGAVAEDLVAHIDFFKERREATADMSSAAQAVGVENVLRRYSINLFIDHANDVGAPVVLESNPNFANLVGRIEHQAVMGALFTDFTMVRPGALHKANGGYLVLDALSLLERPQAWDALKRALKERKVRVEEYAQSLGLISTAVLEPEPIPIEIKVVLTGAAWLYYLLQFYDEDFAELFKVQADFDDRMPRTEANMQGVAQFIGAMCRQENLPHFTPDGVARVIDHSSRLVSDQQHLSTRFRDIADLITESAFWTRQNGHVLVDAKAVQRAIDEKRYRQNRFEERMREEIARGAVLITVTGERVGQINGLSVLPLGDASFGIPSRITARVFMERGGIIDIEREARLGGPIHSKAVMILSSFLGGRYAGNAPLSLRATLVFEQSYGGVEGDSASLAEVCVLISALAQLPLRQDLALTGSINQHGDVQAIGGVNEKVEGFFDTCRLAGELTGTQGVILPTANMEHLALREDVIEAVQQGRFHLYAASNIDPVLELLMGQPIGEMDEGGDYPPDSINGKVTATLQAMQERWRTLKGEEIETAPAATVSSQQSAVSG